MKDGSKYATKSKFSGMVHFNNKTSLRIGSIRLVLKFELAIAIGEICGRIAEDCHLRFAEDTAVISFPTKYFGSFGNILIIEFYHTFLNSQAFINTQPL